MVRLLNAALVAVVGLAAAARAEHRLAYMLQLRGACHFQERLNGLVYELAGTAANGSPYYKVDGLEDYLYFDADCDGGGDGMPRWILDTDRPVPGQFVDLDNDHACIYHARTNTFDGTRPPLMAVWKMKCGEGWADRFVRFVAVTTTSTETSTTETATTTTETSTRASTTVSSTSTRTTRTRTTTTRSTTTAATTAKPGCPETSTAAPATSTTSLRSTRTSTKTGTATHSATHTATATNSSTTEPATSTPTTTSTTTSTVETLVLEGACRYKSFLNGMRFLYQGTVANGAPYYKAATMNQYIYYDLDCNGGTDSHPAPRWIIDDDAPNASLTEDLDEDGTCDYHARLDFDFESDSEVRTGPPAEGEWRMFCDEGWESLHLTLRREAEEIAIREHSEVLYLAGACTELAQLNGLAYEKQGTTVRGAPYYKARGEEQYLYHDPSCDAAGAEPRWILDTSAPNETLDSDLDADGDCDYIARVSSVDFSRPPAKATWRMYCGQLWREARLTFSEEAPLSTSTTTTTQPHLVISAATGASPVLLALAPAIVISFLLS